MNEIAEGGLFYIERVDSSQVWMRRAGNEKATFSVSRENLLCLILSEGYSCTAEDDPIDAHSFRKKLLITRETSRSDQGPCIIS